MAAVKQQHGLSWFARGRGTWPVAVKQFHAVMGGERLMLGFAHCTVLMLKGCLRVLP
ncbi:hypothetical protein D3C85_1762200 [compost metagenome]